MKKRWNLFEFEDLEWFPNFLREGGTDYLRYFLNASSFYNSTIPIISETLGKVNESRILDLCSGGGGSIEKIYNNLQSYENKQISITLTDKFPNLNAYEHINQKQKNIDYINYSVDACNVPSNLKGVRTMFSAQHHFPPNLLKSILKNAVDSKVAICFFDGGDKNIFTILGIIFFHPLAFFFCTPFFKPFKISRLFFTYIVPLIPLYTIWDGCVSILRLYSPEQLLILAQEVENEDYIWNTGKVKNKFGMSVTFIQGYPKT
jgi:hypothetical protein